MENVRGARVLAQTLTFAELLRRERQGRGLTQEGLAERAGLSARAVSDLERGLKLTPHASTIHLLLQALDLDEAAAATFAAAASRRIRALTRAESPGNLPLALTPLIGRQHASAAVQAALLQARCVTLTGIGGVGKTRLALDAAASVAQHFTGGVWLVELASLADPTLVAHLVANTLGLGEQPGVPIVRTLQDGLRTRDALLLLDNCEHLRQACAELVLALLRTCPSLRVLATSREPLGFQAETIWRVPPLDYRTQPEGPLEPAAISLFVERAQAAQPEFRVDASNAVAVAEICERLDGLPLAIELAAALVRVLSPTEITDRLDDRFGLLRDSPRSAASHQRSLQGAVAWSHSALAEPEQRLFEALSVFAGGCTLEAATAVCGDCFGQPQDVLHGMAHLLDMSLITAEVRASARYQMLETLRQYGREQLDTRGSADELAGRHAAYFVALAERADAQLFGPAHVEWLTRLENEHDNLRAALVWAHRTKQSELLGVLAANLGFFWLVRGHWSEGRRWLDSALEQSPRDRTLWANRALFTAGTIAWLMGDLGSARRRAEACLQMARERQDAKLEGRALALLGNLARQRDENTLAHELIEHALACARAAGDSWAQCRALDMLGVMALQQNELETAQQWLEESLSIARVAADAWNAGLSLNTLGDIARLRGDTTRASAHYAEALQLYTADHAAGPKATILSNLAQLAHQVGDDARATTLFAQALPLMQMHGREGDLVGCLVGVAGVLLGLGQLEHAAQLFGAVTAWLSRTGESLWPSDQKAYERDLEATRRALGGRLFDEAFERGRMLPLDPAVERAKELLREAVEAPVQSEPSTRSQSEPRLRGSTLTARERDVVGLVRRGLSNRQIANELVISEKTAINHVGHILEKLAVRSRAELVARAVELGLDGPVADAVRPPGTS